MLSMRKKIKIILKIVQRAIQLITSYYQMFLYTNNLKSILVARTINATKTFIIATSPSSGDAYSDRLLTLKIFIFEWKFYMC